VVRVRVVVLYGYRSAGRQDDAQGARDEDWPGGIRWSGQGRQPL